MASSALRKHCTFAGTNWRRGTSTAVRALPAVAQAQSSMRLGPAPDLAYNGEFDGVGFCPESTSALAVLLIMERSIGDTRAQDAEAIFSRRLGPTSLALAARSHAHRVAGLCAMVCGSGRAAVERGRAAAGLDHAEHSGVAPSIDAVTEILAGECDAAAGAH